MGAHRMGVDWRVILAFMVGLAVILKVLTINIIFQ
jgi:hypothetical protein